MELDNDAIPQLASGFSGGIGNTGDVCCAVGGAVMAISLKMERGETIEDWLISLIWNCCRKPRREERKAIKASQRIINETQ